jgi:hypothetical protein
MTCQRLPQEAHLFDESLISFFSRLFVFFTVEKLVFRFTPTQWSPVACWKYKKGGEFCENSPPALF